MIRWIFFDIGNIILNDDPVIAFVYTFLYRKVRERGYAGTFEEFMEERRILVEQRRDFAPFVTLGRRHLGEDRFLQAQDEYRLVISQNIRTLYPLIEAVVPVLRQFHGRVRLGLLANQPAETREYLQELGLWDLFAFHAISDIVKKTKPDPEFFRWTVEQVGCEPGQTLMIGDRVDNDIRPARSSGMKTLWMQWPLKAKGEWAKTPEETAYMTSIRKAYSNALPPVTPEETPDWRAWGAEELYRVLEEVLGEGQ